MFPRADSRPFDPNSPSQPVRRLTGQPNFGTIDEIEPVPDIGALGISDQRPSPSRMNTLTIRSETTETPELSRQVENSRDDGGVLVGDSWRDGYSPDQPLGASGGGNRIF